MQLMSAGDRTTLCNFMQVTRPAQACPRTQARRRDARTCLTPMLSVTIQWRVPRWAPAPAHRKAWLSRASSVSRAAKCAASRRASRGATAATALLSSGRPCNTLGFKGAQSLQVAADELTMLPMLVMLAACSQETNTDKQCQSSQALLL